MFAWESHCLGKCRVWGPYRRRRRCHRRHRQSNTRRPQSLPPPPLHFVSKFAAMGEALL